MIKDDDGIRLSAYPDHGMLVMGINVKKTVKQPNLKVRFSSLVTPKIMFNESLLQLLSSQSLLQLNGNESLLQLLFNKIETSA